MQPLTVHQGIIVPFNRTNIDTDVLLPKQYLKSLEATGFGAFLFDDERYLDPGEIDTPINTRRLNPACILNNEPYSNATVLLAQANFGCGSSREHAVWALRDFGIRVVIAPSFGDIFRNNCFNNGVLALHLEQRVIDRLFAEVEQQKGLSATINVAECTLTVGSWQGTFELDAGRQQRLLQGLDEIGETLTYAAQIHAYEQQRRRHEPWVFRD